MTGIENDITVVIPTIPGREADLRRAVMSVQAQTLPAAKILVMQDDEGMGAAANRDRGLRMVETPWVAFLDDDDWFAPIHLEHMLAHALETGADFVYSWFQTVPPGLDPFPPTHFSNDFNPADPIETTITTLVRTGIAKQVGFKPLDRGENNGGEDRYFTLGCLALGARISHLKERTWYWNMHGRNTSGLASKAAAFYGGRP